MHSNVYIPPKQHRALCEDQKSLSTYTNASFQLIEAHWDVVLALESSV